MDPRGFRNNNFGNIVDGPFARSLPGYIGADGRFARFETPDAGVSAMSRLLDSYTSRGFDTVDKIVNRWAPPSENDTGALVSAMAGRMGVDPGARLDLSDPSVKAQLINGIVAQENGRTLPLEQVRAALGNPLSGPNWNAAPSTLPTPAGWAQAPAGMQPVSAANAPPAFINAGMPTGPQQPWQPAPGSVGGGLSPYAPATPIDPAPEAPGIDAMKLLAGVGQIIDKAKPKEEATVPFTPAPINRPQGAQLPQLSASSVMQAMQRRRMPPGLLGG